MEEGQTGKERSGAERERGGEKQKNRLEQVQTRSPPFLVFFASSPTPTVLLEESRSSPNASVQPLEDLSLPPRSFLSLSKSLSMVAEYRQVSAFLGNVTWI